MLPGSLLSPFLGTDSFDIWYVVKNNLHRKFLFKINVITFMNQIDWKSKLCWFISAIELHAKYWQTN